MSPIINVLISPKLCSDSKSTLNVYTKVFIIFVIILIKGAKIIIYNIGKTLKLHVKPSIYYTL